MRKATRVLACASLMALGAQQAWAHGYELFGHCTRQGTKTVHCTGGINGSALQGLRIDVLAQEDDAILVRGRLDTRGAFTFEKPAKPFYVLIEAKPGLALEIYGSQVW